MYLYVYAVVDIRRHARWHLWKAPIPTRLGISTV